MYVCLFWEFRDSHYPMDDMKNYEWYSGPQSSNSKVQLVGLLNPNPLGLYDMLGNVWEWVEDYYNKEVLAGPVPPDSGEVHVLKGGSITSDVTNATYLFHGAGPGNGYDVGFRLVRELR